MARAVLSIETAPLDLQADMLGDDAQRIMRGGAPPVARDIGDGDDRPRAGDSSARVELASVEYDRHRRRVEDHGALEHVLERGGVARPGDVELDPERPPGIGEVVPADARQRPCGDACDVLVAGAAGQREA